MTASLRRLCTTAHNGFHYVCSENLFIFAVKAELSRNYLSSITFVWLVYFKKLLQRTSVVHVSQKYAIDGMYP